MKIKMFVNVVMGFVVSTNPMSNVKHAGSNAVCVESGFDLTLPRVSVEDIWCAVRTVRMTVGLAPIAPFVNVLSIQNILVIMKLNRENCTHTVRSVDTSGWRSVLCVENSCRKGRLRRQMVEHDDRRTS